MDKIDMNMRRPARALAVTGQNGITQFPVL
jgi:hypothetical protein